MSNKKNICRPIIISNRSIPPAIRNEDELRNMIYTGYALGVHDKIEIAEMIAINSRGDMYKLWDSLCNIFMNYENGEYSRQVFFAFRDEFDEPDVQLTDEQFWEDITEYPFLFVSVIQFEHKEGLNDYRQELENYINKHMRDNNLPLTSITYLSLDNFNVILVIKTKRYDLGSRLINDMHNNDVSINEIKVRITNAYSIIGITKEFLDKTKGKNEIKQLFGSYSLKQIRLEAVECKPGSIKGLYQQLCAYFESYQSERKKQIVEYIPTIGSSDNTIILNDIRWSDVFELYNINTGILSLSTNIAHRYVHGISTHFFCYKYDELLPFNGSCKYEDSSAIENKDSRILQRMLVNIDSVSEIDSNNYVYYKTIKHIVSSLMRFERNYQQDYIYFSIYEALQVCIDGIRASKEYNDFPESKFLDFVHGIEQIVQNSVQADRQTIQNVSFDTRFYEVPAKLNAYYYTFIQRITRLLLMKGNDCQYRFLVCPSMGKQMQVKSILRLKNQRLFVVELPESQIYGLNTMMIMLAHEVAHCVGREFRKRGLRHRIICEVLASYIADKMFTNYGSAGKEYESLKHDIEKELYQAFKLHGVGLGNTEFIEVVDNTMGPTKNAMMEAISDVLNRMIKYSDEISYSINNILKPEEIVDWAFILIGNTSDYGIEQFLDCLFRMMREAQADIIAILALDISFDEYVQAFQKNAPKRKQFSDPFSVLRIALAYYTISGDNNSRGWTQENLKQISVILRDREVLMSDILRDGGVQLACHDNPFGMLLNPRYIERMTVYLKKCQSSFITMINEDKEKEKGRQDIINMYKCSETGDDFCIGNMIEYMSEQIVIERERMLGGTFNGSS